MAVRFAIEQQGADVTGDDNAAIRLAIRERRGKVCAFFAEHYPDAMAAAEEAESDQLAERHSASSVAPGLSTSDLEVDWSVLENQVTQGPAPAKEAATFPFVRIASLPRPGGQDLHIALYARERLGDGHVKFRTVDALASRARTRELLSPDERRGEWQSLRVTDPFAAPSASLHGHSQALAVQIARLAHLSPQQLTARAIGLEEAVCHLGEQVAEDAGEAARYGDGPCGSRERAQAHWAAALEAAAVNALLHPAPATLPEPGPREVLPF